MIKLKEEIVWILNRKYLLDDCGETKCRILQRKIRIWVSSPYSKGHPDLLSNGRVYVSVACFREASQTLIDKIRCPHQFCHIHGRAAWEFGSGGGVFQGQLKGGTLFAAHSTWKLRVLPPNRSLSLAFNLDSDCEKTSGVRLEGWGPHRKNGFQSIEATLVEENPT